MLIPVYHDPRSKAIERADRADLLAHCLTSLVIAVDHARAAQVAFEEIHIVAIDDHSPADPRQALPEEILQRVTWLENRGPKGQAGALNYAMQSLAPDAFAFTDSDCVVAPDWFAQMAAHYERFPTHGGVAGPNWLFHDAGHRWANILTAEEAALMRFLTQSEIDDVNATSKRIDCRNLSLRAEFARRLSDGGRLFRDDGTLSVSGQASYDLKQRAPQAGDVGFCSAMKAFHQPVSSFLVQLSVYYKRGRCSAFDQIYSRLYGTLKKAFLNRYGRRHFLAPIRRRPLSFWYVWPLHLAFWAGILQRAFAGMRRARMEARTSGTVIR